MEDKPVAEEISNILIKNGLTVAAAESVTAGNVQALLSTASEASKYFQGGITAYNIGQKVKHLGIEPIHAQQCNCVSPRVARELAIGVVKLFTSDFGIGITGYASDHEANDTGKPIAYFSIARSANDTVEEVHHGTITFENSHEEIQKFFAAELLKEFLRYLKGLTL